MWIYVRVRLIIICLGTCVWRDGVCENVSCVCVCVHVCVVSVYIYKRLGNLWSVCVCVHVCDFEACFVRVWDGVCEKVFCVCVWLVCVLLCAMCMWAGCPGMHLPRSSRFYPSRCRCPRSSNLARSDR